MTEYANYDMMLLKKTALPTAGISYAKGSQVEMDSGLREGTPVYRLVIVDDEYEIRNGLCSYFPWAQVGFEVAADFGTAAQTLSYLQEQPVDAVMTDIRMPDMDGLEMIRQIRLRGLRIPIVVVSGYREFDYAQQAMASGVRHYLVKPTRRQRIMEVYEQIRAELDAEHPPAAQSARGESGDMIRRIRKYIEIHYQDATLGSIAAYVKMNPYYLSSFYHQQTGEKLSDYLLAIRMKQAAQLLKNTPMRIQEIGARVGYTTPNSFSRSFHQFFGMTPKDYRALGGER